ncbi:hypothetical protein AGMMS49975_01060 [Clostridia bacterium]|nr:hypothetical protein AGMMS49975_01060 [Clostridia bacterium]
MSEKGYFIRENRDVKAQKILSVLGDAAGREITGFKALDIGTGNGGIARYVAGRGNEVTSVDVSQHEKTEGFTFVKVDGAKLPFPDNSFDAAISNHVIEHMPEYALHLGEVCRVLKKGGLCYFATPNRVFPKELHTKTYFLHWFPNKTFYGLLKTFGKYQEPLFLLTYSRMKKMFTENGFTYKEYTFDILKNPEKFHLDEIPKIGIPRFLIPFSKINIFVLKKI